MTSDVIPYGMVWGNHARLEGLNLVGLKRRGFSREEINTLRAGFRALFVERRHVPRTASTTLPQPIADSPEVMEIIDFIRAEPTRPLCCRRRGRADDDDASSALIAGGGGLPLALAEHCRRDRPALLRDPPDAASPSRRWTPTRATTPASPRSVASCGSPRALAARSLCFAGVVRRPDFAAAEA